MAAPSAAPVSSTITAAPWLTFPAPLAPSVIVLAISARRAVSAHRHDVFRSWTPQQLQGQFEHLEFVFRARHASVSFTGGAESVRGSLDASSESHARNPDRVLGSPCASAALPSLLLVPLCAGGGGAGPLAVGEGGVSSLRPSRVAVAAASMSGPGAAAPLALLENENSPGAVVAIVALISSLLSGHAGNLVSMERVAGYAALSHVLLRRSALGHDYSSHDVVRHLFGISGLWRVSDGECEGHSALSSETDALAAASGAALASPFVCRWLGLAVSNPVAASALLVVPDLVLATASSVSAQSAYLRCLTQVLKSKQNFAVSDDFQAANSGEVRSWNRHHIGSLRAVRNVLYLFTSGGVQSSSVITTGGADFIYSVLSPEFNVEPPADELAAVLAFVCSTLSRRFMRAARWAARRHPNPLSFNRTSGVPALRIRNTVLRALLRVLVSIKAEALHDAGTPDRKEHLATFFKVGNLESLPFQISGG